MPGLDTSSEYSEAIGSSTSSAAESARLSVADQLGPFVLEQLARKIGQNVVTRRLTVRGLRHDTQPMQLSAHLARQPGVNHVRLLGWSSASGVAAYWVSLAPWAEDRLGAYLVEAPYLDVRIRAEDQRGLEAERRR